MYLHLVPSKISVIFFTKVKILFSISGCNLPYETKKLNLSHCELFSRDATLISIALTFSPNIGTVKLSGNYFGDEGTKIIAKAIHKNGSIHHAKLHTLDLGFNNMSDDGCVALVVHAISRNFNLKSLHLSGNIISDKGAIALASVIVSGCGLEKLYLAVNKIGSDGAKALTRAVAESDARSRYLKEGGDPSKIAIDPSNINSLQFSFIKELVLGYNTFGTSGSLSVSNMILTNSSIRVLCMSKNNLGDRELALLSQALTRNKTVPLEVLNLSFNLFSCVGVESLMNAVWGSKHLKELRLDNNRIADRGAQLTAVLLGSVQLKVLDLGFNRIGTVGIKALMKSLSENAILQYLSLSGNILDNISSKALSYALAYNTSLQKLYLDKCEISYIGQRHVAAGIVSNGYLKLQEVTGIQLAGKTIVIVKFTNKLNHRVSFIQIRELTFHVPFESQISEAIVVTLGFPKDCENWDNHKILFFVRTMWQNETYDKYKTTYKKSEGSNIQQQTISGQVDTTASQFTNDYGKEEKSHHQQAPRTGPRNPDTVVAAAKKLFSTEEGVESIMNSLYYRFAKAKKADLLSPNKPLIIEKTISCSIMFHPSIEYQLKYDKANYSQSQSESKGRKITPKNEKRMEGSSSSSLFSGIYAKPFKFDFLEHLVGILREISSAPYVEDDFQQLWNYFFPTNSVASKTISRKSISDISLRNTGMNSRYKYAHDLRLNGDRKNQTFAMHENESNQQATGKRRILHYSNIDSTQRPTLKRQRSNSINDHADRYPRIKVSLLSTCQK